ncbi:MAG: hypothetical protein HKP27_04040, partial [Myxococcales bacterium]|nr:hypothetical protein [Myxococcales bacterium]
GLRDLGEPPRDRHLDWVALVRRAGSRAPAPPPPNVDPAAPTPAVGAPSTANGLEVTGFTLVDACLDRDQYPLQGGEKIDLARTGDCLALRADVSGAPGSVRFDVDGRVAQRIENVAPYALSGDRSGDYAIWQPGRGTYRIRAVPFTGRAGSGSAGAARTLEITVEDSR